MSRNEAGNGSGRHQPPLPGWIQSLTLPVWISGPDRRICFANERARRLLGLAPGTIEEPCFRLVGARYPSGLAFCAPRCPSRILAEKGSPAEPLTLHLPRTGGSGRWVLLWTIVERGPRGAGPWIIHCAHDVSGLHRIECFIHKIASRSLSITRGALVPRAPLTRREKEILALLADDQDPSMIALKLHVSYVTVRNHVQHILSKLGAHSILEAIALHLLGLDEEGA